MFFKYNAVLRGLQTNVPFLRNRMVSLGCPKAIAGQYKDGTISFEEGDVGTDTSELQRQRRAGSATAWMRLQETLPDSWPLFYTGTLAEWMHEEIIDRGGLIDKCTYGDLYRNRDGQHRLEFGCQHFRLCHATAHVPLICMFACASQWLNSTL